MNTAQPFSRQIEALVGPLAEWQGGGPENVAVRFFANGTPDGLRIKFSAPMHVISTASPTVISIYNLGPGIRNSLQKPGAQVVLRAGWINTGLIEFFRGSLLTSVSRREGADIVTDLMCLAGFGSTSRSVISKSFAGRASLQNMLADIAKELPGISIDSNTIKVKSVTIGNQGSSFAGATSDYLDKLSRTYGFSWWINNGIFYALDDEQAFENGKVLISANNGFLQQAEPMLASPMQVQTGVTINSLFHPYVKPGNLVELESGVNKQINGEYKVHSMTHSGDSHSTEWKTGIESWITVI